MRWNSGSISLLSIPGSVPTPDHGVCVRFRAGSNARLSHPAWILHRRRFVIERKLLAAIASTSTSKRGVLPRGKQPGSAAPGMWEVHAMALLLHIPSRRLSRPLLAGMLACTLGIAPAVRADIPAGYPADYQKIIDAAKQEGKVVVY